MQNEQEKEGMKEAHLRDSVALCDHFSWFEEAMEAGKTLTEVELDKHLTSCRAAQAGFVGPSFPTIAGCNANGAVIHYRCSSPSASALHLTELLRVDMSNVT
jgi:Xaa-Pro aminopeptidase